MKSEDGRCSFSEAAVCSQLGDDVKTETCMKNEEALSSVGHVNDQENGEIQKIIIKEEPEDEDFLCGETSSSISLVDQETGEPVKEEEPEDQDYLYCEECGTFFINKCEVHGPPRFISDTFVPMGVSDRARRTLPPGLEVRESGIPNAGLGVFNIGETVLVGVHFGPYQGDLAEKGEAMNSGYSWVIYKNRQCEEYIDAKRETNANWMRYVNCARNDEEQNLVAFQYRGEILYRCCRPIQPGQELLVWYEEEYAKDLGSTFDLLWNKKCSANGLNDALCSIQIQMFSCSLCQLSYMSETYLYKHMRRCHSDEYQCLQKDPNFDTLMPMRSSDCRQTASDPLPIGRKRTKNGIHQCSDCGKSFTDSRNLKKHRRLHTGEKPYQCSQCRKSFARQDTLEIHQRIHTGEKPYQCSQCGKSFTFPSSLRRHQCIHSGEKPYYCSQCGKSFTDPSRLRRHQSVHSGEKPYRCSQCGKTFNRQSHLQTHQHVHSERKLHQCSQCGRNFNYSSSLSRHRRIHSGEKPYFCSQCGKRFTDPGSLRRHQSIHGREKAYHCSECGKGFNLLSQLQTHQLIHSGEKPYQCTQCGKSFTYSGNLRTHQRIHTGEKPYHCVQCGKSFRRQDTLEMHQRIHTGEKPYQCSQCGKSFAQKTNLITHQRIHTGEVFNCSQCGKSFALQSNLRKHQRIHNR